MIVSLSYFESVILYILVFAFSAFASKLKVNNKYLKIVIISLLPFIISGFRYNVGWDYGSYAWGFELFDTNTSIISMFSEYTFGDSIGLKIIQLITKSLNSKFLYFGITSALCFIPTFTYLFNEWDDEKNILSLSVFVTGFSLFFTGLSAIKQGIAISFCLYSLTYVFQRRPLRFIICVFIAFMFHASALVFVPVYFFWNNKRKIEGWKKFCIIVSAILVVIFIQELLNVFGGERFSDYGTEIVLSNNYLFYLMAFWLIVFLFFRKRLVAFDERNELLIILYAIAVILMMVGFYNAFTKRIAYYFDVVQIMLIPQLTLVFSKKSRIIVSIMICIYFVLTCMILNSGTSENMAPIPYSFLFGE